MPSNLPAVRQALNVDELLEKIKWHLTSINSITGILAEAGFSNSIRSTITGTGRVLLCLGN